MGCAERMREKDALKGMCEVQPLNADQSGRRLHEVARVAGRLPSSFSAWSSGLCLVQPRSSEHLYWPAASQDTNEARFTDRQGGCVSRPKKPCLSGVVLIELPARTSNRSSRMQLRPSNVPIPEVRRCCYFHRSDWTWEWEEI
jgi:hypothetical protein